MENLEELKQFLKKKVTSSFKVVVMPDFFLDHFVKFEDDFETVMEKMKAVVERGGGNILANKQSVLRGGNASNLASALATLGVQVTLAGETDPLGETLLEHFLEPLGVDLSLVSISGHMSSDVALEFKHKGRLTNIMCCDMGSLENFGPEKVSQEIVAKLKEKPHLVAVVNWIGNLRGTELTKKIFEIAKAQGSLTFLDTGDLSVREKDIPDLLNNLLLTDLVDILGFNENEALWLTSYYDKKFNERRKKENVFNLADEALKILGEKLKYKICMHTPYYAILLDKGKEYKIPSFDIEPLRATGSGDSWNSGFISGLLAGLSLENQVLLGHAGAGAYLTNPAGAHQNLKEILSFINRNKLRDV
ncbi:MAG: carbohydrate kinase family protein [Candidatus Hydromicrobium sp.]